MDCRSACWPSYANGVRPRAARSVPNASRQGVQGADQRYSGASCWPVRRRRSASSGSSVPPPRRAIGAHHCAEASFCISPRQKMRATVCQTYHSADAAGRNCSGIPCRYLPVHAKIAQANHRLPVPSTNEQSDEILTNEEVVAYLKAGRRTVYRLVANGQIPAFHWAAHGASAVPNWTGGQLPVSARRTSARRARGSHERHLRIICWRRKVSCARQARTAGRGDRRASDQADSTGVQRHRSPGGSH